MALKAAIRLMSSTEFRSELLKKSSHIYYETLSQGLRGGVSSSVLLD
jgi:hypothetical protein